jgi:hypothetical protein
MQDLFAARRMTTVLLAVGLAVIAAGLAVRMYLGQPAENRHAVAHRAADRGGEAADLAADPYATASSGQTGVPGRALSAPNLLPQATAAEKDLVRVAVHKPREESERLLVLSDACCPSLTI